MLTKSLTCPVCGDSWQHVLYENFLRLGPPLRECRACWSVFATGAREWDALDASSRLSYFLQNVVLVLPLLLLLIAAIGVGYLFDLVPAGAAPADFGIGCIVLLVLFVLLTARSILLVLLSKTRSDRKRRVAARSGQK